MTLWLRSRTMTTPASASELLTRAQNLGLFGLVKHWAHLGTQPWIPTLLEVEETQRQVRSLDRRLKNAQLGSLRAMADFDWSWPRRIDREQIDDLFVLGFLQEADNVM